MKNERTHLSWQTAGHVLVLLMGSLSAAGCKKDADALHLPKASTPAQEPPSAGATSGEMPTATKKAPPLNKSTTPPTQLTTPGVLNGTTRATRSSTLAPQISGLVVKVLAREGDVVKPGQPLVLLDRGDSILRLRQAQAARATARAQLAAVRIERKRLSGLLAAKAIPRGHFEKVDAQFNVAKAGLAQAEVAIAMASSALRKTTVKAPYHAVVTKKMTEVGAYATVMPPSPVMKIQQLDPLEVWIQVPEAEMRAVTIGTKVQLRFSALDKTVEATIARVIPRVDPSTRSFTAIVSLANPKLTLRPGMFVEVKR